MTRPPSLIATLCLVAACDAAETPNVPGYTLRTTTARALAGQRPFHLRLTGETQWTACTSLGVVGDTATARCDGRERGDRARVRDRLVDLAAQARSAAASHDATWSAAIIDLVTSKDDAGALAAITDQLRRVADVPHGEPGALNDLAVAHLVSATSLRRATSLFEALDAIERALERDTTSAIALFNRGVVLERLHLTEEAQATWAAYVRLDPDGGWADEARARLLALRSARREIVFADSSRVGRPAEWATSVRLDPQGAREYAIDVVLPRWAHAEFSHDSVIATSVLAEARALGEILARESGDSSVLQSVADVDAAGAQRRGAVVGAVREYASGARYFAQADIRRATPHVVAASQALHMVGATALASWPDLLRAAVDLYDQRYDDAATRFAGLADLARKRRALALQARAEWGLALSAARRGRHDVALKSYDRAASLFSELGERANHAAMVSQQGDVLFQLGREDDALAVKVIALEQLTQRNDPRLRHGMLLELGSQLAETALPGAARAVLREAVRGAGPLRPKDRPEALIRLAGAEARAGRFSQARVHLAAADTLVQANTDPVMQERLRVDHDAVQVLLTAADRASLAAVAQTRVIAYYERQGIAILAAPALAVRGRFHLAAGDTAQASRDLERAARSLSSHAPPSDPRLARDFAASRRSVYRDLVRLRLARHDTAGAFRYAEGVRGAPVRRGRARRGHLALAYTVLDEQTLLWVVGERGERLVRIPISADSLRAHVDAYVRLVRSTADPDSTATAARSLYIMLLNPAGRELTSTRELTVVADGALGRLPFATLRDSRGNYVVDWAAVRYAPSVWAAERARPASDLNSRANAAIVGNPSFARRSFPGLTPLRGAAREVRLIRALYQTPSVLFGPTATRSAVVNALTRSDLFHFAGHARIVERSPGDSHLVLAEDGRLASSVLTATDVAKLELHGLRLAILSACGTAQTRSRRDDVDGGLVSALLDAGASAVISSQWEADDLNTASLMVALHHELRRGVSGPEALRRAQVHVLRAAPVPAVPRVWGAFRYDVGP